MGIAKMLWIKTCIVLLIVIIGINRMVFCSEFMFQEILKIGIGKGNYEMNNLIVYVRDETGTIVKDTNGESKVSTVYSVAGIAVDDSNNFYFGDCGNKRILVYDKNGEYIKTIDKSNDSNFSDISFPFFKDNKLYFFNRLEYKIFIYDSEGNYIADIGEGYGKDKGKFVDLYGIFVDDKGRIFIKEDIGYEIYDSNYKLINYSPTITNVGSMVKGDFLYCIDFDDKTPGHIRLVVIDIYDVDFYYGRGIIKEYFIEIPELFDTKCEYGVQLINPRNNILGLHLILYMPEKSIKRKIIWYEESSEQLRQLSITNIEIPYYSTNVSENFEMRKLIVGKNDELFSLGLPFPKVMYDNDVEKIFWPYSRKIFKLIKIVKTNPLWSPESTRILYETNAGGNWGIGGLTLAGTSKVAGETEVSTRAGCWHPSGRMVGYVSKRGDTGSYDLYIRNIFTNEETVVLKTKYVDETSPCFSPRGDKILYGSNESGKWHVYEIEIATKKVRQLTSGDSDEVQAKYSPDGKSIIYASSIRGNWDIYIKQIEDGSIRQLTNSNADEIYPCWSPNGRKVAYCSNESYTGMPGIPNNPGGEWKIYVRNADGVGEVIQITEEEGNCRMPDWSGNGRKIAYVSDEKYFEEIFVKNADGTGEPMQVTGGE